MVNHSNPLSIPWLVIIPYYKPLQSPIKPPKKSSQFIVKPIIQQPQELKDTALQEASAKVLVASAMAGAGAAVDTTRNHRWLTKC